MDIVQKYYIEIDEDERELLVALSIELLRGIINSGLGNNITINLPKSEQIKLRLSLEAALRVKFENPNIDVKQ